MSDYSITVTLSEAVYVRARQLAADRAQSVENLVSAQISNLFDDAADLPPDEQAELAALKHLSNDTLRTIAVERMPTADQERLTLLLMLNKRATLSDGEQAELDSLLERGDRLMLRKAEAAVILSHRGNPLIR